MTLIHSNRFRTLVVAALSVILMLGVTLGGAGCSGKSKAEKTYEEGMLFFKNRKFFNAIDKFETALKLQPDNARALSKCAEAYLQTGKPAQAVEYAQKALDLDSTLDQAYLTLGQAHLSLGVNELNLAASGEMSPEGLSEDPSTTATAKLDPDEGQHLDKAAEIIALLRSKDPGSIEGMLLQARLDQLHGRLDEAVKLYEAILERQADSPAAQMGLIALLLDQQQFAEAEAEAREALVAAEKKDGVVNPDLYNYLSFSLMAQGKYDEAYEILQPLIGSDNKSPDMNNYLTASQVLLAHLQAIQQAQMLDQTGLASDDQATSVVLPVGLARTPEAMKQAYDTAVDRLAKLGGAMKGIYPTEAQSWYIRGISYELADDAKEMLEHYQEAVSRRPLVKQYRLKLAAALLKENQPVQAMQEVGMLLQYLPTDFDARLLQVRILAVQGNSELALENLRRLQVDQPKNREVALLIYQLLANSSDPAQIQEALNMASDSGNGQMASADDQVLLNARLNITNAIQLAKQGRGQEASDLLQKSEVMLREALAKNPQLVQAELQLSNLAVQRSDLVSALHHARAAAKIDPRNLLQVALLYQQLGQYAAARQIFQTMLTDRPEDQGLALKVIDLDLQMGQPAEALATLDRIIAQNPAQVGLVLRKAQVLSLLDRRPEAEALLTRTREQFKDQPELTLALARMLMADNEPGKAAELLNETIRLAQELLTMKRAQGDADANLTALRSHLANLNLEASLAELLAGNPDQAIIRAQDATQIDPRQASSAGMIKALALFAQGNYSEVSQAIADLKLEGTAKPPALTYLDALAVAAQGQLSEAEALLDKAVGLNRDTTLLFRKMLTGLTPEQIKANGTRLGLMVYFAMQNQYANAVNALCDATLAELPGEPFVLTRKAEALALQGQVEEALQSYSKIVEVLPDFAPVQLAMADLELGEAQRRLVLGQREAAEEKIASALAHARQAIALAPDSIQSLQKLALILQGQGKSEEANGLYRQLIQIDPNGWAAYNNLAWNLAEAGQLEEARKVADQALALVPELGGVLDTVGWIAHLQGDTKTAVDLLTRASLRAPNIPDIRFHRAQVLAADGQVALAVEELEMLLSAMPGYPSIGAARELLKELKPESPLLREAPLVPSVEDGPTSPGPAVSQGGQS